MTNSFTVDPFKQDVICSTREAAVALQEMARGLPTSSRHKVKAGLYPDSKGHYRVALTVTRMGLLDGLEAIRALSEYVEAHRFNTVYRGERELALIR